LHKISVDLPKKHGRGGQSAGRFARIRLEKRHNYLTKVAALTTQCFITADKANVSGLIMAGLAEFKKDLQKGDLLDSRLRPLILGTVDVSYGGESGFNQAIELSGEILRDVKFMEEKKLLGDFFEKIELDAGLYCYGVHDTMYALEQGAVEKLIVWEELDLLRLELQNSVTGEKKISFLSPKQRGDKATFTDEATGAELELKEEVQYLEWLTMNFKSFGTELALVSDKTTEGTQFCKGFGGIGGTLRWKLEMHVSDEFPTDDEEDFM